MKPGKSSFYMYERHLKNTFPVYIINTYGRNVSMFSKKTVGDSSVKSMEFNTRRVISEKAILYKGDICNSLKSQINGAEIASNKTCYQILPLAWM